MALHLGSGRRHLKCLSARGCFRIIKSGCCITPAGQLIHIGHVTEQNDPLYVLDTTNPGAQNYLRQTYSTLYHWGVRLSKMDFMDDTAVEGSLLSPQHDSLGGHSGSAWESSEAALAKMWFLIRTVVPCSTLLGSWMRGASPRTRGIPSKLPGTLHPA